MRQGTQGAATTTVLGEPINELYVAEKFNTNKQRGLVGIAALTASLAIGSSNNFGTSELLSYSWRLSAQPLPTRSRNSSFHVSAATNELINTEDSAATNLPTSQILEKDIEPDSRTWRGVFSPTYNRRILFSKSIKIQESELPRWKPHITIDRRILEIEDD